MLKLKYIIVDTLPQEELFHLKRNLEIKPNEKQEERKEKSNLNFKLIRLQDENKMLFQYLPEECLLISADAGRLSEAASLGMATLGYLQKNRTQEKKRYGNASPCEKIPPSCESDAYMEKKGLSDEEYALPDEGQSEIGADMYAEGMDEVDAVFLNRVYLRHHNLPWTILETERCVVREFSMDDLDALFELYAGDGMTDYIEPLYDYEEEKEYQQAYIRHMYGFYGYGMWIVCDKKTGNLIGRAGVEHREELGGEPELGYAIGTPYQKQGYAAEVCTAILTYIKEELEMPRIFCLIDEKNRVSAHFAEKLGFSFEEDMDLDGKIMKKYKLTFEN